MPDTLTLQTTGDGSLTFFSQQFQEPFHSTFGAKQEAEIKFVIPSSLVEKSQNQSQIGILDLCYGLGYNTAAALDRLQNYGGEIQIIGLENNLDVPQTAFKQGLLNIWTPATASVLGDLATQQKYRSDRLTLDLILGDARQTICQVPNQWADAIFFDPFSPKRCPQLWTIDFLKLVAACLKPQGYLVTYSCAAAVRSALQAIGLTIWATTPLGRKAPGTIASFSDTPIPPLANLLGLGEQEILQTRAGIPYRDRHLTDIAEVILARRQTEQSQSPLRSTSNWLKQYHSSKLLA